MTGVQTCALPISLIWRFWSRIKISPEKWNLSPWGDEGGGFWVVAVMGQECVYFNDIEDGFNISQYKFFGRIDNYYCDQIELECCVRRSFYQAACKIRGIGSGFPIEV